MASRRSTAPASPRSCASPSSSPAKAACCAWSAATAASATPSPSPASSKPSPPSNPNPPPSPTSRRHTYPSALKFTLLTLEELHEKLARRSLPALFQFRQHQLGQFLECLEHAYSLNRNALQNRLAFLLQLLRQFRHRHRIRQVPLVQLQHIRNRREIQVVLFQVLHQVFHRFEIRVQPLFLRIRHEHHAVRTFQDQLAAGLIENLSRHGIQMKARFESPHRPQIQWQEIEKQRAVRLRRQRHHLALLVLPGVVVDPLQVGGFSAQTWTVIHELAVNFARWKIDERHVVVNQNSATNL